MSESNPSNDGYNNIYTQLYVPSSMISSTDLSANVPGAYFRLGGYSDIEFAAYSDENLSDFYPRKHIDDADNEDTDNTGNAPLTDAPGSGSSESGILLACNGRLLVQATERAYIASTQAMSIDSADTLTITADGEIDITSGDQIKITSGTDKNVTISAGDGTGNVSTTAKTHTTRVLGEKYDKVTKDSYSFFQADSYAITMGRQTSATFGGRFALWVGASFSFNTSVDVTISFMTVNMWMALRVNIGTATFDLFKYKLELQDGKIVNVAAKVENNGAQVGQSGVNIRNSPIDLESTIVDSRSRSVSANVAQLRASISEFDSSIGIKSHM